MCCAVGQTELACYRQVRDPGVRQLLRCRSKHTVKFRLIRGLSQKTACFDQIVELRNRHFLPVLYHEFGLLEHPFQEACLGLVVELIESVQREVHRPLQYWFCGTE